MSALTPATERRLQLLMDLGERAIIIVFFAAFVVRVGGSLAGNPFNIITMISDGLVVLFMLIRRPSQTVSTRPLDWVLAMGGTLAPLMVRPALNPLAPLMVGALIMLAGLICGLWAKVSLQRSFGIAPANRGVIESGPYRLVRHPMYAGYILVYVGFLLNNPSLWNLAVYVVAIALQVARILAEERVLSQDPDYQAMMGRVRYRLIPGLF
jgi:protein-S-isoprenylcysteine O-methyltransferase Ste14